MAAVKLEAIVYLSQPPFAGEPSFRYQKTLLSSSDTTRTSKSLSPSISMISISWHLSQSDSITTSVQSASLGVPSLKKTDNLSPPLAAEATISMSLSPSISAAFTSETPEKLFTLVEVHPEPLLGVPSFQSTFTVLSRPLIISLSPSPSISA